MKWTISVNGTKAEARKSAGEQSDDNITAGNQTQAQKTAVLAAVDAVDCTHVSGSVSGQNDGTGNVSVNLTGHNE